MFGNQQMLFRRGANIKIAASWGSHLRTIRESLGTMTPDNTTGQRSRHKHRWQNHLCECGARQCAASELRRMNESGQCRCSAQPDHKYCKRHSYIERVRFNRGTPSQPTVPNLEAA